MDGDYFTLDRRCTYFSRNSTISFVPRTQSWNTDEKNTPHHIAAQSLLCDGLLGMHAWKLTTRLRHAALTFRQALYEKEAFLKIKRRKAH